MANASMRILVADDFELARNIAKKELANLGYSDFVEAVDGEDAFQKMQQAWASNQPFHLVLSDWHMPNCTGLQFLQKIRNDENFKATPFIMVSAESETDAIVSALQNGASDFICKPLVGEVLAKKINRILGKANKTA